MIGNKVKLVPVNDQNLRELYGMWNDPEFAGEFGGFDKMSWDEFAYKFAKGASWFLIEKIGDGARIGWIDYYWTRSDYPYLYEIGYALSPTERRNGYMTEAAKLIVEHLFATKDIERVESITDTQNLASQGVLEKAGFKREGLLRKRNLKNGQYRDEYIYGILREDLEQKNEKSNSIHRV
jgi:RimJ/RimL family protein N-acetyltransferase